MQQVSPGQVWKLVAVFVVGFLLVFAFSVAQTSPAVVEGLPAPSGSTAIVPDDGVLLVGGVKVPQLPGVCTPSGVCAVYPPPEDQLPVVAVDRVTSLSAQLSTSFSAAAVSSGGLSVSAAGGQMFVEGEGSTPVVVTGDTGARWAFIARR